MQIEKVEINGVSVKVVYEQNMAWVFAGDVVADFDVNRKLRMAQFLNRMCTDGYSFVAQIEGTLYFRK